ncbi:hypothetical protein M0R45_035283 [Rubus argutus]|uniref:Uncharacterized protein n=1 Tax=Rubus argutus TaxID=59490 RepID=A0AAW1VWH1_RUBAR
MTIKLLAYLISHFHELLLQLLAFSISLQVSHGATSSSPSWSGNFRRRSPNPSRIRFDLASNHWIMESHMPRNPPFNSSFAIVVLDGELYVITFWKTIE